MERRRKQKSSVGGGSKMSKTSPRVGDEAPQKEMDDVVGALEELGELAFEAQTAVDRCERIHGAGGRKRKSSAEEEVDSFLRMDKLKNENERLKRQLEAATEQRQQAASERADQKVKDLEKEVEKLKTANASGNESQELHRLREQLRLTEQEKGKIEAKSQERHEKNEKYVWYLTTKDEKLASLRKELDELNESQAEMKKSKEALRTQLMDKTAELDALRKEKDKLYQDQFAVVEKCEEELEDMRQKQISWEAQRREAATNMNSAVQTVCSDMRLQLRALAEELGSQKSFVQEQTTNLISSLAAVLGAIDHRIKAHLKASAMKETQEGAQESCRDQKLGVLVERVRQLEAENAELGLQRLPSSTAAVHQPAHMALCQNIFAEMNLLVAERDGKISELRSLNVQLGDRLRKVGADVQLTFPKMEPPI